MRIFFLNLTTFWIFSPNNLGEELKYIESTPKTLKYSTYFYTKIFFTSKPMNLYWKAIEELLGMRQLVVANNGE